jgi:RNA polymerase sigma-70 factor (ECF subfamily)
LRSLVGAAVAGDRHAFAAVVRLTWTDTNTLAFRLTGNDEDAADVVQETYLRAWRAMARFRGDAEVATWLYRITANCAANQRRKSGRTRHDHLDEGLAVVDSRAEHDPEVWVARRERRDGVTAALAALPPALRQVVVLRDIYDLPHRVIARELGISEAAAKVRLHRARNRLRQDLRDTSSVAHGSAGMTPAASVGERETIARAG